MGKRPRSSKNGEAEAEMKSSKQQKKEVNAADTAKTPRRTSMRVRAKQTESGPDATTNNDPHAGPDKEKGKDTRSASDLRSELSTQYSDDTEGMKRAMKELGEMEGRLHRACKRQRQQIENSDVKKTKGKSSPSESFIPKLSKQKTEDVLTDKDDRGDVPEKHGVTQVVGENGSKDKSTEAVGRTRGKRREKRKEGENIEQAEQAEKHEHEGEQPEEVDDKDGARPPPVNSGYLPLPWNGRIGYACLNTYLRTANPPVFCSRTCRIASILENRHPLQDPDQPKHSTKNRPDRSQPADIERGQKYVQELGLANARDIVKMLRWNDKYGIKFMRLSSEMFPFASHQEYGYKLASFASETLAEAGKVAAELGHRLTVHPGQFTQLGSPRPEVIVAAVRDLEYHDELLSLLKLPEQQDKDAVMILHMGGTYGDKAATLDRFRENYAKLSPSIKRRLVLENDDVSWSVHDLLPICEELDIPMVLDFHHHNIIFDADSLREGTADIMGLFDRIAATWSRKGITQKMHYSEPCAGSVTRRDRRKHSARVKTLPPCAPTMDLMIEAKDKEQAVFELMRTYRLPGWDRINDVVPYEREDEVRRSPRGKKNGVRSEESVVLADDFAMGGPLNRVYWPEGLEEWLKPKKREIKEKKGKKKKEDEEEEFENV